MEDLDYFSTDIFDDDESEDVVFEEDNEIVFETVIEEAYVPYNDWYKETNECIENLTNFMQSIETTGFENWWHDWWMDGVAPEDAAMMGVLQDGMMEAMFDSLDEDKLLAPKPGARYGREIS